MQHSIIAFMMYATTQHMLNVQALKTVAANVQQHYYIETTVANHVTHSTGSVLL